MRGVYTGALDRRTMEGISTAGAGPLIGAPNRPPRVILPVAVKLSYMKAICGPLHPPSSTSNQLCAAPAKLQWRITVVARGETRDIERPFLALPEA